MLFIPLLNFSSKFLENDIFSLIVQVKLSQNKIVQGNVSSDLRHSINTEEYDVFAEWKTIKQSQTMMISLWNPNWQWNIVDYMGPISTKTKKNI